MTSAMSLDLSFMAPSALVLVAVSGGADSLALLWLLRDAAFQVHVAHVNHGLRGTESDDDETFVRELCAREKIEYSMRRVLVENVGGHFSEDAARQKRYAALLEMARENSCGAIVTGHTADDNLETILLHMARGASVEGWSGIPPTRTLEDIWIVRPLLNVTRAQTEAICIEANWKWREDSSNSSTRFRRNRVRHELIPLLTQIGEKHKDVLALQASQSAILRRDESELLNDLAREELAELRLEGKPNALTFDGAKFAVLPIALQRRVLRLALRQLDLRDVSAEQLEDVRRHVAACARRRVWCLKDGVRLEWTGAMAGNRVRVWRVEKSAKSRESAAETTAPTLL